MSHFVSDFDNLGLFPPQFIQIYQGLVNLVYLFKELAFCFVNFLVSILLISTLNFIISLLLCVLGFALLVLDFLGV
jgi:hypothetical protein